jgi:hypothetical protein
MHGRTHQGVPSLISLQSLTMVNSLTFHTKPGQQTNKFASTKATAAVPLLHCYKNNRVRLLQFEAQCCAELHLQYPDEARVAQPTALHTGNRSNDSDQAYALALAADVAAFASPVALAAQTKDQKGRLPGVLHTIAKNLGRRHVQDMPRRALRQRHNAHPLHACQDHAVQTSYSCNSRSDTT